ncbi:universal stress protein [Marinobacterium mangrovicola]|uniref:Nucleotide-binding universal stress UspA family protein n=1 Tax=Marinobacterium mangrovicola TaxID=1476959 RepID=A0A4R1G3W9_9GAMM|nr:universal stress protein [Marinobacterium mangrovicola]TCK02374.1 nucleotide-binding universal stress UspA family protein [Marinobacterium mangrovicola]
MYNTILVPVDLSEEGYSDKAVMHALEVLAPGGKLVLLTVVAGYQMPLVGSYFPPGTFDKAMKSIRHQLEEFVDEKLPFERKDCEILVEEGKPADTILSVAKQQAAELIVMAGHKHSAVERTVLGSVANKVVSRAQIPVLVIKG